MSLIDEYESAFLESTTRREEEDELDLGFAGNSMARVSKHIIDASLNGISKGISIGSKTAGALGAASAGFIGHETGRKLEEMGVIRARKGRIGGTLVGLGGGGIVSGLAGAYIGAEIGARVGGASGGWRFGKEIINGAEGNPLKIHKKTKE